MTLAGVTEQIEYPHQRESALALSEQSHRWIAVHTCLSRLYHLVWVADTPLLACHEMWWWSRYCSEWPYPHILRYACDIRRCWWALSSYFSYIMDNLYRDCTHILYKINAILYKFRKSVWEVLLLFSYCISRWLSNHSCISWIGLSVWDMDELLGTRVGFFHFCILISLSLVGIVFARSRMRSFALSRTSSRVYAICHLYMIGIGWITKISLVYPSHLGNQADSPTERTSPRFDRDEPWV